MKSKTSKVRAEHRKFREAIAMYVETKGALPKAEGGPWQMHHVVDSSYDHPRLQISEWYLLPIEWEFHDEKSTCSYNVTHHRKRFCKRFGSQRTLFLCMIKRMEDMGLLVPPPRVMEAIMRIRH
jgi:hypothetical protein